VDTPDDTLEDTLEDTPSTAVATEEEREDTLGSIFRGDSAGCEMLLPP
jgi:hypothetical protein